VSRDKKTDEPNENLYNKALRLILKRQLNDINQLLALIFAIQGNPEAHKNIDRSVLKVIATMTHMIGISGETIIHLTEGEKLQIRDAFPVARSITELAINICYIMATGEDCAKRADNHAEQKLYRKLHSNKKAGAFEYEINWSGEISAADTARFEKLMADFQSKKGREKNWIDLNIHERLIEVERQFPKNSTLLSSAYVTIYSDASEIVHGSYYGAMYFWQPNLPTGVPKSVDGIKKLIHQHQQTVLLTVIQSYISLIACYGTFLEVEEVTELASAQIEYLTRLMTIIEDTN